VALTVRRLRPPAVALLALVAMAIRPGYLPQPYVIALLPFCAVVAMGVLDEGWSRIGRDRARRLTFIAVAAAVVGVFIVPRWLPADSLAMSTSPTRPVLDAQRWVIRHLNHRARVLADDTFYVDLVRAGFAPRFGVVWFYKLDYTTNLDPMIVQRLPQGWRAFDYVISTDVVRSALAHNPSALDQVRQALSPSHSTLIAQFGSKSGRVEVRRITGVGTGSGLIPPYAPRPAQQVVAATPRVVAHRVAAIRPSVAAHQHSTAGPHSARHRHRRYRHRRHRHRRHRHPRHGRSRGTR
jgi:hypothetical protein